MTIVNQVNRNFISNLVNLLTGISVGIFYTPYLIKCIGVAAYGIIPLAFIVNQYINVIATSLTGSLTRFYSVSIQKGEYEHASKYLSNSFIIISFIILILSPFSVWFVISLEDIFNIPISFLFSAKLLFSFTLVGFAVSLYSSLFNITLYALNRIDLMNVLKIIRSVMKVLLTICFFNFINIDVSFIGLVFFLTEFSILCFSFFLYKQTVTRKISLSFKALSKSIMLAVLSMTILVIIQQIGDTGLYRTDNFIVNKFWSVRESGILGAVSDFGTYIMTAVGIISSLSGPVILIAYSKGEYEKVRLTTLDNSFYVGLIAALIAGVMIGFSKPIIMLWIGPEYVSYSSWMILKLYVIPFYASAGVFAFVYRAWNYLKIPAFLTLTIGLLNLIISIILCKYSEKNESCILYMLIITSAFTILQSYVLCAYCFSRLYNFTDNKVLIINFFKIFGVLSLSAIIAFIYGSIIFVERIFQLLSGLIIASVISLLLSFLLVLKKGQKKQLIDYGKSFLTLK